METRHRNVVDSSGWLEWLVGSEAGKNFAHPIIDVENLVVPSVVLYEIQKKLLVEGIDRETAARAMNGILHGTLVDLNQRIAFDAAQLAFEHKLAMADAIILATAREHQATLYTQDVHFRGIPGVKFFGKTP
jgi:predicted nucleic acid-binding protein